MPRIDNPLIPPARQAALAALNRIDLGRDLQEALDSVLSSRDLDPKDTGLATEIVYGTLRLALRLDTVLNRFLSRPDSVPHSVRTILRAAAYEILYLDRVPGYASVDWAVTAAHADGEGIAKMTNAVLRRVTELGKPDDDFFRESAESDTAALSRIFSMPEWVVKLWLESYGPERTEAYLAAAALPPLTGFRVNRRKDPDSSLFSRLRDESPFRDTSHPAVVFRAGEAPRETDDLTVSGHLSRQSAASQEALLSFSPDSWTGRVWDACAGHGGKTCLLRERIDSPIIASDRSYRRLSRLPRELDRLGLPRVPVFMADGIRPPLAAGKPSVILLDVPCSGLGVLSRRPDGKWKRTSADARTLVRTQSRILRGAAEVLAPKGHIAYMTCTLNPAENEGQVRKFLDRHSDFSLASQWSTPHDSPLGEFFFCALLEKA